MTSCLQGDAMGKVFIDDGHSFDYKNGKFMYRTFNFTNNTLIGRYIQWSPSITDTTGTKDFVLYSEVVVDHAPLIYNHRWLQARAYQG